jgi:hypothetical protein
MSKADLNTHLLGVTRVPLPKVFRLVSEQKYLEAVQALEERPQDAFYEGSHGDTALHVMCRLTYCPWFLIRAVEAILNVDPTFVEKPNQLGQTPLHFACVNLGISSRDRISWEKVVLKMIKAYPPAVNRELPRNLQAKTPFHWACAANASSQVLGAMLEHSPDLATKSFLQVSESSTAGYPLFLLWNAVESSDDWSKMELLLRAATGAPLQQLESTGRHGQNSVETPSLASPGRIHFDVLNAACRVNPCPRDYLSILVQRYPHRAAWVDQQGLLPIHHVILNANSHRHDSTKFLLQSLLRLYPTGAACPFSRGNQNRPILPLHYFIYSSDANWSDYGIDDLIAAYPDALRIPDPRTGLVPALASVPFAINSRAHLTTTYNLLLKSPEIFENRMIKDGTHCW